METVEDVILGDSSFTRSMDSYNNTISILNSKSSAYNNSIYSSYARSVGTNPNNPNKDEADMYRTPFDSDYDKELKDSDTNYQIDWNQMKALSIESINEGYWLASRQVTSNSDESIFNVRNVLDDGGLYLDGICFLYSDNTAGSHSCEIGLRPIFHLKSGIKVIGGKGTSSSPYTLGI